MGESRWVPPRDPAPPPWRLIAGASSRADAADRIGCRLPPFHVRVVVVVVAVVPTLGSSGTWTGPPEDYYLLLLFNIAYVLLGCRAGNAIEVEDEEEGSVVRVLLLLIICKE